MKLPKRGERGFTLIELLIVVAILGVLAAVVIPNVQRFIGAGEEEAKDTELATIQASVSAMMVDNVLPTLPDGFAGDAAAVPPVPATNNMSEFPHKTAVGGSVDKMYDPDGIVYLASDKAGYILYQHDIKGGGDPLVELVNYVAQEFTVYLYWVNSSGTVFQGAEAPP